MKGLYRLLLTGSTAFCVACSTPAPDDGNARQGPASGETVAVAEMPLPDMELSGELMYQIMVAQMAARRSEPALAAEGYLRAARTSRDPRLAQLATRQAVLAHNNQQALEAARLWQEVYPESVPARRSLASLLIHFEQPDEAMEHLAWLLDHDEEGAEAVSELVSALPDKQGALQLADQLLERSGGNTELYYTRAKLAFQMERLDEALQDLERLFAAQPRHKQGLLLKAEILRQQGDEEGAVAEIQRVLEFYPDDDNLRLTLGRTLIEMRRTEEAMEHFKVLVERQPDSEVLRLMAAALAAELGDYDYAERQLERLVESGQHGSDAAYLLGQVKEQQGDTDVAIHWFSQVSAGDSYFPAHGRAAFLIARRDGLEAGRDHLRRLDTYSREDGIQRYGLEAQLLAEFGSGEEVLALYDEALQRYPGDTSLLYSRALAGEAVDRLDILERDLRTILADDPDNIQALNALGYTLADRTERYEEAYELVQRAYQMSPTEPAILDSMGWVLFRMGRHAEAVDYLKKALESLKDGEVAAHLGEVLWQMGRQDEARQVWDAALDYDSEDPVLVETRERFIK